MQTLNLERLRSLAAVAELGSFSAAAERAGLSQPAISLQVRQLERELGMRLIERVGRRASPTAAGAELLMHAQRIETAVREALQAVRGYADSVGGRVRLGTGATACAYLLPPMLAQLRRRYPQLEVVVSTGNTADIMRAVEDNRLDIALVTLPVASRSLEVTPTLADEFVAIMPAESGWSRLPATPAALADVPLVLFEPGAQTRRLVDEWFGAAGLTVRPTMELGSVEAMKELAAAGLGCAVLPGLAISGAGLRPGLAVRRLTPRLSRRLGVVMRRDKPLGRGLQQVLNGLLTLRAPSLKRAAGAGARPRQAAAGKVPRRAAGAGA